MLRAMAALGAATLGLLSLDAEAETAAEFYEGKTLTYIVASAPGGGYDTYARLIARHLPKYLPVAKVQVKNIAGAGHIIGANTTYAAKPDGLTIGTFNTGLIYGQVRGQDGILFDLAKMSWVGKAASEGRSLVLGAKSGFKDFEALRAAPDQVKIAAAGLGSAGYLDSRLLVDALDLNWKLVPGFEGTEAEMSVLRGEVVGTIGSTSSFKSFVDSGQGFYALEMGGASGSSIPQATAYVKDERGRAMLRLIESQSALARLTAGPPGIPDDKLALLRQAYMQALADPELLAEAGKLQIPIDPLPGAEVAKLVEAALVQPPEAVAFLREISSEEPSLVTVKAPLLTVADDGKLIEFKNGADTIKSTVSGSRTRVTVDGADADRKQLQPGMECEIAYATGGSFEAATVACGG